MLMVINDDHDGAIDRSDGVSDTDYTDDCGDNGADVQDGDDGVSANDDGLIWLDFT